jgi:outer membrane receptor for ferrienterochelin and colicins
LLLIDSYRINDNVYDSTYWDNTLPVDIDLIERVEIIRGPGSTLYGSNALLAVINVITKTAQNIKGAEVSGETASHGTKKGRISYGHSFDENHNVLVSATGLDSKGQKLYFKEFDSPATHNGEVWNDDEQFQNYFVRANAGELSFTAAHTAREKGIPTAPWETYFGDTRTRTNDDTTLLGTTYTHEFTDDFAIRARADYHTYDYDGRYVYDGDNGLYVNMDNARGRWLESELQFIAKPADGHKVTWGVEERYNFKQDQKNWDSAVYLDDHQHNKKNWGIYAQDEWTFLEKWTLVGGVRHDYYGTFGGTTNPRMALMYHPYDSTTIKLLYGSAFRAPNCYELYYNDGGATTKAPDSLAPETIKTYEAVLEQKLNENLSGVVSVFQYKLKNVIEQYNDPADDLLVFRNSGNIKATGIDTAIMGKWKSGFQGRAGYSFVEAKDEQTDEILVNAPKHLAKFNLIAPVIKDSLFAGIELQYTSKAKTLAAHEIDDFWITNLTLTYENILKGLELSVSVYNVFDVKYGNPGAGEHTEDIIEQDGRSFRVKLTYRF